MNKDINKTLMALVPILKMNGENVTNIEAVHDWYKVGDREYMKEVAEITYDNGTVRYADIGCDSNLTAIYDVIAVIQQIKPRSKAIERIERGVYSLLPAQPEQRWIPCSERLPEDIRPVIVTWKNTDPKSYYQYIVGKHFTGTACYKNGKWYWYSSTTEDMLAEYGRYDSEEFDEAIECIAWMPLPEPYKGGEQDE